MRKHLLISLFFLAVIFESCHKSTGSPVVPILPGSYMETSPDSGTSTLTFVNADSVILTGSTFFLIRLSAPDTLKYYLRSVSGGSLLSFVSVINSGEKDTLTCNYALPDSTELDLSFKPCSNTPCYGLGGTEWIFKKQR